MIDYKKMNSLLNDLDNNTHIYLCGHKNPDQDSICSCLALCEYLRNLGKNAEVLLNDEDRHVLSWINPQPKTLSSIPEKEKYIFIALDLNRRERLGIFSKYFNWATTTFNIDHHEDNKYEADFTLSMPDISSTCEMIYNIIVSENFSHLTKHISELLYSGIVSDTNGFTRRLSENTFGVAQVLINTGIDYNYIVKKTITERSMYELKALATAICELKFNGKFYYVIFDQSRPEYKNLLHNDITKKIAEDIRKLKDSDLMLFLIKNGTKTTVKVASNIAEIANQIAQNFGGGGHKREAGFTVYDKTDDEILSNIKDYLTSNF